MGAGDARHWAAVVADCDGCLFCSTSAKIALQGEPNMANVFVEPEPKGRPEGTAITHYVLEYAHGARVTNTNYRTQAEAISAAKELGHSPLVARVRKTDKGNPDHWRSA